MSTADQQELHSYRKARAIRAEYLRNNFVFKMHKGDMFVGEIYLNKDKLADQVNDTIARLESTGLSITIAQ